MTRRASCPEPRLPRPVHHCDSKRRPPPPPHAGVVHWPGPCCRGRRIRSCVRGGVCSCSPISHQAASLRKHLPTMKIIITGGGGFLGHQLAQKIIDRGTLCGKDVTEIILLDAAFHREIA